MQEATVLTQVLLPLVAGIVETKNGLLEFVHGVGMRAVDELLTQDAARLVGPKGRHQRGRTGNHWGRAPAQLTFGGRRVTVNKPRVRGGGRELALPAFEELRASDPLPERVLQQILLGVSTRGYDASIEAAPPQTQSRGTSKSAASRHVVARTEARMREHLAKRLDGLDLVAMFLDGIEVAGHSVIAALGVVADGAKVPLGLWVGSTENATVCTALLQDLLDRGLRVEERAARVCARP
jgi:transposase-like protein